MSKESSLEVHGPRCNPTLEQQGALPISDDDLLFFAFSLIICPFYDITKSSIYGRGCGVREKRKRKRKMMRERERVCGGKIKVINLDVMPSGEQLKGTHTVTPLSPLLK